MSSIMLLISFLLLTSTAYGQLQLKGTCTSDISYEKSFNFDQLLGTWYEIKRIDNTFEKGDCVSITFTAEKSNNVITAVHITHKEVVNNKLTTRIGNVTVDSTFTFHITLPDNVYFNFVILKANYNDYAILYSCLDQTDGKSVLAWQLSRTTTATIESNTNFESITKAIPELESATWTVPSYSEGACKSGGYKLHLSRVVLLFIGLLVFKEM